MTNIFCFKDHILMQVDYDDPKMHRHLAKHVIFSLEGEFSCIMEDKSVNCSGLILESNILHTIRSFGRSIIVLLIEETSNLSLEISDKYLHEEKEYFIIDDNMVNKMRKTVEKGILDIRKIDKSILEVLRINYSYESEYDERIKKILYIIDNMNGIDEDIIEKLSREVFLSKSRMLHLFKEETGIPLSSYLVIQKMEKTYKYIIEGKNITEAAVNAGFSSPSHFSMVCSKMFGLKASSLNKNANFIYISANEES